MSAEDCVFCGKCLEVCPLVSTTGREELAPRSKAVLLNTMHTKSTAEKKNYSQLAKICLGCERCVKACPQGVNIPYMLSALRAESVEWKHLLWKQWIKRAGTLWPRIGKIVSHVPHVPHNGMHTLSSYIKVLRGLGRKAMTPLISLPCHEQKTLENALLFQGCTASFVAPYWTKAATGLCKALGISLIEAEFECCGLSLHHAGLRQEQEHNARHNIEVWRTANRPRVFTFCVSCHAGLTAYAKNHALFLDQSEAETWKKSLIPLSERILPLFLNFEGFVLSSVTPKAFVYHKPCHIDGKDFDYALLCAVLNTQELAVSKECCGFGGIMQLAAPQLVNKVAKYCWETLAIQSQTLVLTGCSACVLQLEATSPKEVSVAHWLELFT